MAQLLSHHLLTAQVHINRETEREAEPGLKLIALMWDEGMSSGDLIVAPNTRPKAIFGSQFSDCRWICVIGRLQGSHYSTNKSSLWSGLSFVLLAFVYNSC